VSEITFYIGDLVEHESDRAVLRETARVLEELGRPAVVMANIELGRQIDLVVALDDRALVIEAKGNRTAVRGSVNGTEWQVLASSGKWKPFRNPLQQLAQASFALRDKLRTFVGSEVPYSREALIFCPAIPPNSDIPIGDFKAAIGGLSDLGRLLATPGKLRLPLDRWHAFAQHLQLTRVSNVEVACDERLISAEMLILEYLSAFRETYAPASEELIPVECVGTAESLSLIDFAERCARGDSLLLRGSSGCGKTLAACRAGLVAIEDRRVPIFLYGRDFEGEVGTALNREVALLGAGTIRDLLMACRRLGLPILLLVDGYNECAEVHREALTRAIVATCRRYDGAVAITSQIALARGELLPVSEVMLALPSKDVKLAIASRRAKSDLTPAARSWIATVKSGLEARIIGEVQDRMAEPRNRSALFDAYVRGRLGLYGSEGIRILTSIAGLLSDRISFSLSVRDLDRLADAGGFQAGVIDQLEAAGLLVRRGDRASFGHEMYLDIFAAEAVARRAKGDIDVILGALKSPLHAGRGAALVGAIDDQGVQLAILLKLEDTNVVASCLAGECGSYAQAWAQSRAQTVLRRMADEAEHLSFEIDETCYPAFRRTDAFAEAWSPQDRAIIEALPDEFLAGRHVERMMSIIAATDLRLRSEFLRLRETIGDRKIGVRSGLFELCYVHGSNGPAIGTLVQRLHIGRLPQHIDSKASEILRAWVSRSDLTHGQVYVLLMLDQLAWDEGPFIAPRVPEMLRTMYRFAPYHLQLDLLQAAHFSHRASEAVKQEIIEALQELPNDQHIFLSTSVVEALQSLGALDDSEVEQIEPLRDQLRGLLARADADAAELAYTIWISQFDHPYAGAYCQVVEDLTPNERKQFLTLAGRAARLDGFFSGILIIELAAYGDPAVAPIVARWLVFPSEREVMPQHAIRYFVTAHIALARLGCVLPPERPSPRNAAERALGACGEILFWLNRYDLPMGERLRACSDGLALLAKREDGAATAILHELNRCHLGEGLDRLPGDEPVCKALDEYFREDAAEICRSCLRLPELQKGYFVHSQRNELLEFAIVGLGRWGSIADVDMLRALARSEKLGRSAIQAIAHLEQRVLSPADRS
jgi:hypothetical protein